MRPASDARHTALISIQTEQCEQPFRGTRFAVLTRHITVQTRREHMRVMLRKCIVHAHARDPSSNYEPYTLILARLERMRRCATRGC